MIKSAIDYYDDVCQIHDEITKKFSELNEQLSHYDEKISAIHHEIENNVFNEADGYNYAKQLQEVLHARRIVKNEIRRFYPLVDLFNDDLVSQLLRRINNVLETEKYEIEEVSAV